MPPVARKLESSPERLPANGFTAVPRDSNWCSRGCAATSDPPIPLEAPPRALKYWVVLVVNGPKFANVRLMPGAAAWSAVKVGVACSASASSRLR